MRVRIGALAALATLLLAGSARPRAPLPASRLAVRTEAGGAWREWWRSDRAPATWRGADALLARALRFRPAGDGLEWGETTLAGSGEAWRTRLVVVVLDPARWRLRLDLRLTADRRRGDWSAETADSAAVLALNAGQFSGYVPWGWLVHEGREIRVPGVGPTSAALAVDTAGRLHWLPPDSLAAWRHGRGVVEAFQSYPTLLEADGRVVAPLRAAGLGLDVEHRDARLAVGRRRDGRLVVALTRFDGLGGAADRLPFGLTTPELAAVMGALGCREAMALDGGLSAQLRLQDANGERHLWRGSRRVPLGLVAVRGE